MLPAFSAAVLTRIPEPFTHRDWIFELKYDGFRGLAFIDSGDATLVSRNGNVFRGFEPLRCELAAIRGPAILDGEIVCLARDGTPRFLDLFYRRGECHYFAFDLLWHCGRDLRELPLVERKRCLKHLRPSRSL